jgi:DnaJ domain
LIEKAVFTGDVAAKSRRSKSQNYHRHIATFYELLGVPQDASPLQVRDAYRQLALVFHPDTSGATSDDMALLNEAWHTLSDPGRRTVYDASLRPKQAAFRRFDAPLDDDGEPEPLFTAHRFSEPRRWPAAALMVIAAMAVIFVFTAYAVSGGRGTVETEITKPLVVDTCVSIRPGAAAVQVPCTRPHFGVVKAVMERGAKCLPGTEGYFDRNSDAMVCVHVG